MAPLDDIPCFSKGALRLVFQGSEDALNERIKRAIKKGSLIPLKKGLYTTARYMLREGDRDRLIEFIASALWFPSYISLEYVLAKRGLLTEAVYPVTSVTCRNNRLFQNALGSFRYASIKESLFTGFCEERYRNNVYSLATPAKAMFDCLYLKRNLGRDLRSEIREGLRINWENFSSDDLAEFSRYAELARSRKMKRIARAIEKEIIHAS